MVNCDCGYSFTNNDLDNLETCPKCEKYFCYKCGTTKKPNINIFGYNGDEYTCSNCGELLA